jgi:hypothetical protein
MAQESATVTTPPTYSNEFTQDAAGNSRAIVEVCDGRNVCIGVNTLENFVYIDIRNYFYALETQAEAAGIIDTEVAAALPTANPSSRTRRLHPMKSGVCLSLSEYLDLCLASERVLIDLDESTMPNNKVDLSTYTTKISDRVTVEIVKAEWPYNDHDFVVKITKAKNVKFRERKFASVIISPLSWLKITAILKDTVEDLYNAAESNVKAKTDRLLAEKKEQEALRIKRWLADARKTKGT